MLEQPGWPAMESLKISRSDVSGFQLLPIHSFPTVGPAEGPGSLWEPLLRYRLRPPFRPPLRPPHIPCLIGSLPLDFFSQLFKNIVSYILQFGYKKKCCKGLGVEGVAPMVDSVEIR